MIKGERLFRDFVAQIIPAALSELDVDITFTTPGKKRDGDSWDPAGAQLANYLASGAPVLAYHDPNSPVGNASALRVSSAGGRARVTFAAPGISAKADEVRGLVKGGVLSGISCGILPLEWQPIDRNAPRNGNLITSWELLEISFVSVPADPEATVTARSLRAPAQRADAARRLAALARLADAEPSLSYAERKAALDALQPDQFDDWLHRQETLRELAGW